MKYYIYPFLLVLAGLFLVHALNVFSFGVKEIDAIFMISLVILLLGGCIYVKSTGIFTLFFRGFTDIQLKVMKHSIAHQEEDERVKNDSDFQIWKKEFTSKTIAICIGIGGGLLLFSFTITMVN